MFSLFQRIPPIQQEQKEQLLASQQTAEGPRHSHRLGLESWTVIDVLSIAGFVLAACIVAISLRYPTDMMCAEKLSTWSPMRSSMSYQWQTLFDEPATSKYSGPPSEDLERAWFESWAWGATAVQIDDLPKMNKLQIEKNWTMLPAEVGGGVKAHIQVLHYMHCVDILRQWLYRKEWDYTAAPAFRHGELDAIRHVEHCIEVIRIELVCIADVTMYPVSVTSDGERRAHADAQYKCPKWSLITKWANENAAISYDVAAQS